MFSIQKIGAILGVGAALLAGHAGAADKGWVDSASVDFGSGSKVRMLRLGVQKDWDTQWFASNGRHLAGYWDLSASWWRGKAYRGVMGQHQNLAVIGITPVLRYESDDKLGWYAEGGIGANLFSELYNNNDHQLSTAFQFGDHIGIGYVTANKWDLALKFQHYSNASIKSPNSGANFLVASVRYHF
jgi:lipid A 3-O-deacylase